jgi:alpha-1,3-mannosyltransferase
MRILHICKQFYPSVGGIEDVVYRLSQYLIGNGHSSDVLSLNRLIRTKKYLSKSDTFNNIKISRISFINIFEYTIAPDIIKHISNHYDIVHIHGINYFSDYLLLLKYFVKKPIIISTHGGYFHTKKNIIIKKIWFNTITKYTLRKANRVVTDGVNDFLIFKKILNNNITTIENGVNSEYLSIKKNIEKYSLIYWGRICENKRVDNLIEVINIVRKKIKKIKLFIIGESTGNNKQKITDLIKKYHLQENVIIFGYQNNHKIREMLSKAHLFINASEYEGFGITVIEAMGSGTVPFVNNIIGFKYFIKNNENGYLVNFNNHLETANKLIEVVEKNLSFIDEMGKKARIRSLDFSWEKLGSKYVELYKNIMSNG